MSQNFYVYIKRELIVGKKKAIFPKALFFKIKPTNLGFYIDCEELNIRAYSDCEETIWEKVFDELLIQRDIYANEDPTLLTEDAKAVRDTLMEVKIEGGE